MIGSIQLAVRAIDAAIARVSLGLAGERNAVTCFMFHSLFRDRREIETNEAAPLQGTTVGQFRQFVEYYLGHGYRFIKSEDLYEGPDPIGKYALVTFDDGYFNNTRALSVLEEFRVPATFFIATDHVMQNKSFWWDVLHRELVSQGASAAEIEREALGRKGRRTAEIEAELTARFGLNAFQPRGETDRPFAPDELRDFARSPYVHIGNHTAGHAILTNYSPEEARAQVLDAQTALADLTGVRPSAIAFPNGAHSRAVVETCEEAGLKVAFTIRPEKYPVAPATRGPALLRAGRFTLTSDHDFLAQCRTCRSDVLLYGKVRAGYLRLTGAGREVHGARTGPAR